MATYGGQFTLTTIELPDNQCVAFTKYFQCTGEPWTFNPHTADFKRWYLCPQVRVADIVQLNGNIRPRSRQWWQLFRMVSQWHVDVVIVERRSFSIVAAVELDDASHLRPERRRRDILLEEVLRQAGIPLLRSHDARKLLQMTGEWLNTTGADQQSPEHRS